MDDRDVIDLSSPDNGPAVVKAEDGVKSGLGLPLAAGAFGLVLLAVWVGTKTVEVSHEERLKSAVAAKLRDPGSAEFRNIIIQGDAMCGEINGRNGYGAYAGFVPFVVQSGRATLLDDGFLLPLDETDAAYHELKLNRESAKALCRLVGNDAVADLIVAEEWTFEDL